MPRQWRSHQVSEIRSLAQVAQNRAFHTNTQMSCMDGLPAYQKSPDMIRCSLLVAV